MIAAAVIPASYFMTIKFWLTPAIPPLYWEYRDLQRYKDILYFEYLLSGSSCKSQMPFITIYPGKTYDWFCMQYNDGVWSKISWVYDIIIVQVIS